MRKCNIIGWQSCNIYKANFEFTCIFSHLIGREQINNLVYIRTRGIRLTAWDISILMGKAMKLVDVIRRRKIDIVCLQEAKRGGKDKKLGER